MEPDSGASTSTSEEGPRRVVDRIPVGSGIITKALLEKAKKELRETDESVKNGLWEIKELIRKEKIICCEEDTFLIRFLRVKKFNVRKSFDALKQYRHLTSTTNRHCGPPDVDAMRACLNENLLGLLPYRDAEGTSFGFFRLGFWNADICAPGQVMNTVMAAMLFLFEDPAIQIAGYGAIFDIRVIPHSKIPLFIKYATIFISILPGFPGRVRRFDFINDSPVIKFVYSVIKPLIPKKLRSRVMFHSSDMKTLHQYYHPSILFDEYGGELGPITNELFLEKLEDYAQKLKGDNHE